ncbi:hypothetical protein HGA88_06960 [Candidatus Roizmanbacteria bacterium]|nr:hypothetical protein [Candidatus Roizmanbacteria bacterium]
MSNHETGSPINPNESNSDFRQRQETPLSKKLSAIEVTPLEQITPTISHSEISEPSKVAPAPETKPSLLQRIGNLFNTKGKLEITGTSSPIKVIGPTDAEIEAINNNIAETPNETGKTRGKTQGYIVGGGGAVIAATMLAACGDNPQPQAATATVEVGARADVTPLVDTITPGTEQYQQNVSQFTGVPPAEVKIGSIVSITSIEDKKRTDILENLKPLITDTYPDLANNAVLLAEMKNQLFILLNTIPHFDLINATAGNPPKKAMIVRATDDKAYTACQVVFVPGPEKEGGVVVLQDPSGNETYVIKVGNTYKVVANASRGTKIPVAMKTATPVGGGKEVTPTVTEAPKPTATVETAKPEATVVAQIEEARKYFNSLDIEKVAQDGFYMADGKDTKYSSMILEENGSSFIHKTRQPGTYGGILYAVPTRTTYEDGSFRDIMVISGIDLGAIDVQTTLPNGNSTSVQVMLVGIAPTTNAQDRIILPVVFAFHQAKEDSKVYASEMGHALAPTDSYSTTDGRELTQQKLSSSVDPTVKNPIEAIKSGKGKTVAFACGDFSSHSAADALNFYSKKYPTWTNDIGLTREDMRESLIQQEKLQSTLLNIALEGKVDSSIQNLDASHIPWGEIVSQGKDAKTSAFAMRFATLPKTDGIRIVSP